MDHYTGRRKTNVICHGYWQREKDISQKSYHNSYMDIWGLHIINMHYKYNKNKGLGPFLGKRFPTDYTCLDPRQKLSGMTNVGNIASNRRGEGLGDGKDEFGALAEA